MGRCLCWLRLVCSAGLLGCRVLCTRQFPAPGQPLGAGSLQPARLAAVLRHPLPSAHLPALIPSTPPGEGSWGFYGLLSWLPSFFKDQYHVELAQLASFTMIPYVVQGGVGAASGGTLCVQGSVCMFCAFV